MLHQQVLTELVYVLLNRYDQTRAAAAGVLRDLLALPGVKVVNAVEWPRVLDLWPDALRDFAGAVLAAITLSGRHDAVATFDEKLSTELHELGVTPLW